MARVPVLLNCNAGAAGSDPKIGEKVADALAKAGFDAEVELIDGGKCEVRCRALVERGDRLIVVGGGDGTVSAAASALVGSETLLGILPVGTLNHFARDLGIPFDIAEAAKVIAQAKTRKVDIAEVNGHTFINNASIGLYPLMVMDRDGQRKRLGRSKRLAMLVASLRTMARFHSRRLTLSTDGGEAKVDTPLLFVGNNDYQVALPSAGRREALDDGELCVMVMRSKSLPGFLAAIGRALIGIKRREEMVRVSGVKELKVDSPRSHLSVAMDGETVSLKPPLVFRIRPGALNVIAPA